MWYSFGCNCDGGCRQYNTQGCLTQAQEAVTQCGSSVSCGFLNCWQAGVNGDVNQCAQTYLTAVNNCNSLGGASAKTKHKRDFSVLAQRDANDTSPEDGLFDFADVDNSGTLALEEYLSLVNFTKHGALTAYSDIVGYVKHFFAHDANKDGLISWAESHGLP